VTARRLLALPIAPRVARTAHDAQSSICMILETERLALDTWQMSDWTALCSIATGAEMMRYFRGGVPWC